MEADKTRSSCHEYSLHHWLRILFDCAPDGRPPGPRVFIYGDVREVVAKSDTWRPENTPDEAIRLF